MQVLSCVVRVKFFRRTDYVCLRFFIHNWWSMLFIGGLLSKNAYPGSSCSSVDFTMSGFWPQRTLHWGHPSQGFLFSSSATFTFKSCHSQLRTLGVVIFCVTLMFLSVVLIQKTPSQVFSYKCCILVGSGYRTHRLRAAVSVARHKAIKVKSLELFLTACMVLKHGLSR